MTPDGTLLLEGGAEFGGRMADPDLAALQVAGGLDVPVAVLPTAAAPDHNDRRAGGNALRWFASLGATHAEVVPVIDRASADDPDLAARIGAARLIYMLGGFPAYVASTLAGSRAWQAALDALRAGAVLGGSSAGAMVLAGHLYDPQAGRVVDGLGLLPGVCVLPHHNTFGHSWAARLAQLIPAATLLGIDEQTGILNDAAGLWRVHGAGRAVVYRGGETRSFAAGETFALSTAGEK